MYSVQYLQLTTQFSSHTKIRKPSTMRNVPSQLARWCVMCSDGTLINFIIKNGRLCLRLGSAAPPEASGAVRLRTGAIARGQWWKLFLRAVLATADEPTIETSICTNLQKRPKGARKAKKRKGCFVGSHVGGLFAAISKWQSYPM